MRAKYLKGKSIFYYNIQNGASFIWKGIVKPRKLICKVAYFSIGDGEDINTNSDPWVLGLQNFIPISRQGVDARN